MCYGVIPCFTSPPPHTFFYSEKIIGNGFFFSFLLLILGSAGLEKRLGIGKNLPYLEIYNLITSKTQEGPMLLKYWGPNFFSECYKNKGIKRTLSLDLNKKKYFSYFYSSKLNISFQLTLFSAIGPMYSDAGLLGAMIVAEGSAAGKVTAAVAAAIRSISVTEADVAAAKKNLIVDVMEMQGSPATLLEDIGSQVI